MKKENLFGILMYLLVFAIAIIYGFTILQSHFNDSSFNEVWKYALYILVSVFSGVIVVAILQEFGHILGARVGGYKITSVNVLYFNFYINEEGKHKFRFKAFDGLTGETKISPNYEKKERPNPYPFLIYGTIFNLAFVVVAVFLFFNYYKIKGIYSDMAYYFLTMGIITVMSVIYNIIPVKLDSLTDGYRLTRIKKDVDAFNALLENENGGVSSSENNEESIKKPAKFIPEVAITELTNLIVNKEYDKFFEVYKKIKENGEHLSDKDVLELSAQYVYVSLLTKDPIDVAKFYDEEVSFHLRREFSNSNNFPVIRSYIYIAGLMDGSLSEVLLSCKKIAKAYRSVANNRKHDEVSLYNETLDLVLKAHPKWEEINNYKIVE